MECKKEINLESCGCTYLSCSNRGKCCQCVRNHRDRGEIPGCFFSVEGEKTYNRTVENLVKYPK